MVKKGYTCLRRQENLIFFILIIVFFAVVSGCGRKETSQENLTPALSSEEREKTPALSETATSSSEVAETATSMEESASGGEEIDTSEWKTYRNEEYGFELKYPEEYKKTEVVGEFYNNEEYPRMGVSFLDPKTERGTFEEIGVTLYDKGWVGLGPDLFDSQIFDFNKKTIKDITELKNTKEFLNGEIININDLVALKIEKNYELYVIIQNPINLKFLIFSTINFEDGDVHKDINDFREKLMMQILSTVNFIKNGK